MIIFKVITRKKTAIKGTTFNNEMSINVTKQFVVSSEEIKNHR